MLAGKLHGIVEQIQRIANELMEESIVRPSEGSCFRWWHLAAITAFCTLVFFTQLGATRLWDRDETRNAGCAAEMLQADNWTVPIFNSQLRRHKPILTYWLMMSSYQVFGITEFAARFWSAILAVLTCLMTWRIGWRLLGYWPGMLAAMILPGTVMFSVSSRAATPDSPLIFCFTLVMLVFVEAMAANWRTNGQAPGVGDSGSQTAAWSFRMLPAVLLYLGVALGGLSKGLAGVLPPLAAIGLFLMIMRTRAIVQPATDERTISGLVRDAFRVLSPLNFLRSLFSMRPVLGLVVILLVAGPWFVAVGIATQGEFLRLFFLTEHLGRATEAFEGHSGGPWYYPVALMIGFLPWSIFAVPVIGETFLKRSGPESRGTTFLVCWVLVVVGMFTLASTKLPSYVTPCYPALALLTASAIHSFANGMARVGDRFFQIGFASVGFFAVSLTIGLSIAGYWLLGGRWELGMVGLPLMAGSGFLFWCQKEGGRRRKQIPFGLAIASGLFSLVMFGPAAQIVDSHRQTDTVLSVLRSAGPDVPVGSFRCLESSWVVYGQHPIYELTASKTNDHQLDESRNFWEKLPWVSPRELVDRHPGALILTTNRHLDELRELLGQPVIVISEVDYFMRDWRLILVSISPESAARYAQRTDSGTGPFVR